MVAAFKHRSHEICANAPPLVLRVGAEHGEVPMRLSRPQGVYGQPTSDSDQESASQQRRQPKADG